MSDKTPAQIFTESEGIAQFRESIIRLNGAFDFEKESLLDLGKAYFKRYPDRFHNRNTEEVQIGYGLVRICVIEKIIDGFDDLKKEKYRFAFANVGSIEQAMRELAEMCGPESLRSDFATVQSRLDSLKAVIDTLPVGMIKERFVGGISNIFNVVYLIKLSINKIASQ